MHLPVRIMPGLLGLPAHDRARFRAWDTALIHGALNPTGDPAVAVAANTARDELDAYLRPLATCREIPGTDLISTLATTTVEGDRLTDEQIVRFAMLMVFAGGEAPEKGLSTTLRNLPAHPDALAAVRQDGSLPPRAIAESFRYTALLPRGRALSLRDRGGLSGMLDALPDLRLADDTPPPRGTRRLGGLARCRPRCKHVDRSGGALRQKLRAT